MTNQVSTTKNNIDIPRLKILLLIGLTTLIIFMSIGALFVLINTTFAVILVLIAIAFPVTLLLKSKYRVSISFILVVGALLFSMFASQDLIQTNIIHAGPIGLRLEDIFLLLAFFLTIIEGLFLNTLIISKSNVSFLLFIFICWHIICIGVSQINGIPLRDAIYESRPFIYLYAAFFITTNWKSNNISNILLVDYLIIFGFISALAMCVKLTAFLLDMLTH